MSTNDIGNNEGSFVRPSVQAYIDPISIDPTIFLFVTSQVLDDTWSVVVSTCPEDFSVIVAPFEGMQSLTYKGEPHVDSRDLYYDPRGWWRHARVLTTNTPTGPCRLHRLPRGLSASGLPQGAGSLNAPLEDERGATTDVENCSLGITCEMNSIWQRGWSKHRELAARGLLLSWPPLQPFTRVPTAP